MPKQFITSAISLVLLVTSAVAGPSNRFPESTQVQEKRFYKMGEHRTIYKLFFKLYDAALFTEQGATPEDVLERNCAFYLEFRYLRNIPQSAILESAEHMLDKNLSPDLRMRLNGSIEALHATYRSVAPGDRSSLTYRPETGTTFAINGETLVTIPGKEFAKSYLEIWLGTQPISVKLRDQLLAQ